MGVIAGAAIAIASVVGAAVSTVAAVVSAVTAAVGSALAAMTAAITAVTASIGAVIGSIGGAIWSGISAITSVISSVVGTQLSVVFASVEGAWPIIKAGFTAFAEAIHLKTLLHVHQIAYMVSGQYRSLMQGVYSQIGEVSRALGLGTHYVNLVLRDARALVLDVSTTLGKRYDLAQVTWLVELNNYMHHFSEVARRYERNPWAVIEDLEEFIERPAMDAKGSAMQAVFTEIEGIVTVVDATIETVGKYRDDVANLVSDLPEFMRKEIRTFTDPIIEKYDTFILQTIRPHMETVDGMLSYLQGERARISSEMGDLVNRLKRPGDYLRSIDRLSDWSRRQEEDKIAEIAGRSFRRDAAELSKAAQPIRFAHYKVLQALKYEPATLEWMELEFDIFMGRPGAPLLPRETWNVGDY